MAKKPQTQFLAGEAVSEAGAAFAREVRLVPAPGSAHAIRCAVEEAIRAREERQQKTGLFNLSGRGSLNLSAYQQCLSGE